MLEDRIKREYNKMTLEEKYKLLDYMETKNLGYNDKQDKEFIEGITNIILDTFTIIAKIFHII